MVAGKNNPAAFARNATTQAIKLPPLPNLRVRRPNTTAPNPCLAILSSMLGCWASSGQGTAGCAVLEDSLRQCMDTRQKTGMAKSNINMHLARFKKQIEGPTKRK